MGIHVGIIPDGNRRYARENNKSLELQYQEGYQRVKEIVNTWSEEDDLGVNQISFFVCSQDNLLKRTLKEVDMLHQMLRQLIEDFGDKLPDENRVKLLISGRIKLLPDDIRKGIEKIRRKTKKNGPYILRLAIAYDGREEIMMGCRRLVRKGKDLDEKNMQEEIGKDMDLVIRTGKEKRLSGFFPWQTIYSELIFLDNYWPEFSWELFHICIQEYHNRKRRYGQ